MKKHFSIEAVVTKPATMQEMALIVPGAVVKAVKNKEELSQFISSKPFKSRLGIIVDFGIIVDQVVIDYFPLGIVNSHFSLLPQWRGADPITFAILSGQDKTGVSLMLIEPTLDTGMLLAQEEINILAQDTALSLTDKLVGLSNSMFVKYLPKYIDGQLKPYPQPAKKASYSRKLLKSDGIIDWNKPAVVLEREIRAFAQWPKSQTVIANKELIVCSAHANTKNGPAGKAVALGKQLLVYCGEGALVIDTIKPVGKKEMSTEAFLAGYKHLFSSA